MQLGVNADSGRETRPVQGVFWTARSSRDAAEFVVAPSALPADLSFLFLQGFDFPTLYRASQRALGLGVAGWEALVASGALDEETYLQRLGRWIDAPVIEQAQPDPRVRLEDALRQGWCRARLVDGRDVLLVSCAGPLLRVLLETTPRLRHGQVALATGDAYRSILIRHFSERIALDAAESVPGALSARSGAVMRQKRVLGFCAVLSALCAALWPQEMLTLLPLVLGLLFLGASLVMLSACVEGAPLATRVIETNDTRLPRYSILVPLYREAEVVEKLIAALNLIDYPREKLQVLLVIEEHDLEVRSRLERLLLPASFSVLVAPAGAPHTKPRALNAAMPFVTGEHVVVYDAEDEPDPDQLRAAAAAFRAAPKRVACLQARLAIDNTFDSVLTRLFTIEYAALFDVVKAGNARLGLPVPLGGTSNHFRVEALRRIGLWDAWNVTEDADLGIRLAQHRLLVDDLPSTTTEEAPSTVRPWLAQRTRWLKGWMQTVVVHSRAPLTAIRAMGPVNFFSAVSMSAGVVVGALGAPIFYALLAQRLMRQEPFGAGGPLDRFADAVTIVLGVAGLLSTVLPALLGLHRRRLHGLIPWIALLPLYQLLVSVAAWRAFFELLKAPHRWNKTRHGLARTSRRAQKQATQAAASSSTKTALP
ncbi:MAG TPA: glycosyl transferase [Hyphomonas sp.]|nr:glycosyl transferase [Hyphomonas sp.]